MADAYPAFDFRRNDNPGSGSGPMGGPGAFAPGNTPVVYGKNQSPLEGFMQAIGVNRVEGGQAYGSTGGMVHMWDDQRRGFQALAAAQQEQEARQRQAQGGQQQVQQPQNTFLPGAPTATGDVRFNYGPMGAPPQEPLTPLQRGNINLNQRPRVANPAGGTSTLYSMSFGTDKGEVLVPRVSEDGRIMSEQEAIDAYRKTGRMLGVFASPEDATRYADYLHKDQVYRSSPTPMIGRDYGQQAATSTPLSTFGQRLLATGGTETRDGAVFSGAGGKLSITQDMGSVPMGGAPSNPSEGALARIMQGASRFSGPDQQAQIQAALASGAFNTKPQDGVVLTPEQQAALDMENAQLNKEAAGWLGRIALPNAGTQPADVFGNRMAGLRDRGNNAFLPAGKTPGADTMGRLANEAKSTSVNSRYDSAGTFVDRETGSGAIAAVKDRRTGKLGVLSPDGTFEPIDQKKMRPMTTSDANPLLDGPQFKKLSDDVLDMENSIRLIDKYMGGLDNLPQGVEKLATKATKAVKTLFTKEPLTEEEMNLGLSGARQQALLGALRTSILGPGVLTEIDAQRIIARMGGDISSLMGNPELMKEAISEVLDQKLNQYDAALKIYNSHVKGLYNSWGLKEKKPVAVRSRQPQTKSMTAEEILNAALNPQQ